MFEIVLPETMAFALTVFGRYTPCCDAIPISIITAAHSAASRFSLCVFFGLVTHASAGGFASSWCPIRVGTRIQKVSWL